MSVPNQWSGQVPAWTSAPAPRKRRILVPVARIDPQREYDFRILTPELVCCAVHFDGDRTGPCTDLTGANCWADHANLPSRAQLWCGVLNRVTKVVELLCLTQHAYDYCPGLAANNGQLRGARLKVWRQSKSVRGRMAAALDLEPMLNDQLPGPPNVRELLEAMWHANLRDPGRQRRREEKLAGPPADDDIPH